MEDWAEIRRLHRAEGVPDQGDRSAARGGSEHGAGGVGVGSAAAVRAGAARVGGGCVRAADSGVVGGVPADAGAGDRGADRLAVLDDAVEEAAASDPSGVRRDRPGRPGRLRAGQITQCDLWFPETTIPVGRGQERILPVLVMTLAFSRFLSATMIPSRQGGDSLSGMWALISQIGRVTKTLVWDRESAIGGTGRVSAPAAAFAGTLATTDPVGPAAGSGVQGDGRAQQRVLRDLVPARPRVRLSGGLQHPASGTGWHARNARTVRSIQAARSTCWTPTTRR